MSASDGFLDFLRGHLSGLGAISARRMFGGAGIYCDGRMFALVADDVLYLKADAQTAPRFEAEGLEPFVFKSPGRKPSTMSYRRAPEAAMDDPEIMGEWADLALEAARRAEQRRGRRHSSKGAAGK